MPLAQVMMSGVMPKRWQPNQVPSRPNPQITSSAISSTSWAAHSSCTRCQYPGAGWKMPPAPITGSPMKAAIESPLCSNRRSSAAVSSVPTDAVSATSVPIPSRLAGMPARLVPYAFMPW